MKNQTKQDRPKKIEDKIQIKKEEKQIKTEPNNLVLVNDIIDIRCEVLLTRIDFINERIDMIEKRRYQFNKYQIFLFIISCTALAIYSISLYFK